MTEHWEHKWFTALFSGIVIINHRLHLDLVPGDLAILAAVLGVHQFGSVARIKAALNGGSSDDDSKPEGS